MVFDLENGHLASDRTDDDFESMRPTKCNVGDDTTGPRSEGIQYLSVMETLLRSWGIVDRVRLEIMNTGAIHQHLKGAVNQVTLTRPGQSRNDLHSWLVLHVSGVAKLVMVDRVNFTDKLNHLFQVVSGSGLF